MHTLAADAAHAAGADAEAAAAAGVTADMARAFSTASGATEHIHIDQTEPAVSAHVAMSEHTAADGTQLCVGSHLTGRADGAWRGVPLRPGQVLLALSNVAHKGSADGAWGKLRVFAYLRLRLGSGPLAAAASNTSFRPAFGQEEARADLVL